MRNQLNPINSALHGVKLNQKALRISVKFPLKTFHLQEAENAVRLKKEGLGQACSLPSLSSMHL